MKIWLLLSNKKLKKRYRSYLTSIFIILLSSFSQQRHKPNRAQTRKWYSFNISFLLLQFYLNDLFKLILLSTYFRSYSLLSKIYIRKMILNRFRIQNKNIPFRTLSNLILLHLRTTFLLLEINLRNMLLRFSRI